jgi:hypothetical protein
MSASHVMPQPCATETELYNLLPRLLVCCIYSISYSSQTIGENNEHGTFATACYQTRGI